jgi:O-antigen/teichoic acid export membrane protein
MSTHRGLARNTIINFCGQTIILVIAIFAIPIMIKGMGTERFGVLALMWSFIGYFSLFDLGLGRALTNLVARSLTKEQNNIPSLIWTGFSLLILLGIVGGLTIFASAPWLVRGILKIPFELQDESLTALYLIAAIFPFVITQAGFRGVLEGLQRFDIVNGVSVTFGIFSFAGSLFVLPFSKHLGMLAAVVIVGRLMGWMVSLGFCFKLIPNLQYWRLPEFDVARRLLTFGGWMTVTNVVGPLMVYLDRFLIGAWLSVAAVAYYTTPYDVVTKLWIIPGALVGALFPLFSTSQATNPNHNKRLFSLGVKYIYIALYPLTLLIVAFAREGLTFWLDAIFSAQSSVVLQWLAVGVLINSLAHVPFALIQGAGRPDLTAKLHLLELPLYLVCVSLMIQHLGIKGAAIAWMIRVSVDSLLLFFLAWHLFLQKPTINISFIFTIIASLLGLLIVSSISSVLIKLWVCLIMLAAFIASSYRYVFTADERLNLIHNLNGLRGILGINNAR